MLIGGDFRTVNGVLRQYAARLYGADVPPSLRIGTAGGIVTISWPLTTGFILDQSLTATGVWSQAAFPYSTNGSVISFSHP